MRNFAIFCNIIMIKGGRLRRLVIKFVLCTVKVLYGNLLRANLSLAFVLVISM